MVSTVDGKSLSYALFNLQERGRLFIGPGEAVYQGMIVGIHSRGNDLVVNPSVITSYSIHYTKLYDDRGHHDTVVALTDSAGHATIIAVEYVIDQPRACGCRKVFRAKPDQPASGNAIIQA